MEWNENLGNFDGTFYHVTIEQNTIHGMYRDTLHFSASELAALTEEQLTTLKTQRVDNWVSFVTVQSQIDNPNPEPPPVG